MDHSHVPKRHCLQPTKPWTPQSSNLIPDDYLNGFTVEISSHALTLCFLLFITVIITSWVTGAVIAGGLDILVDRSATIEPYTEEGVPVFRDNSLAYRE